MKTCATCHLPKSLDDFIKDNRRPDGRGSWCLECSATWKRSQPAEKKRSYNNAYYASNAEKLCADARQYRIDHQEQVRAKEKRYYTENPEVLMLKTASKRARERGLPFSITAADIKAAIPRDGRCPVTRELFVRGEGKVCQTSMTLDRIKPELGYVPGNIAVISHLANTIKQNCTDPEVFRRLALYLEEHSLGKVA
jgi:hypothetical protein